MQMIIKYSVRIAFFALVAFFIYQTGLLGRLFGLYSEVVKPPVRVGFRASAQFWKDPKEYVMQLSNMDAQKGLEFVLLRDGKQDKQYRKYLSPGETNKELGELEIGSNFKSGDTGYIKVVGYELAIRYDLSKMDANGEFFWGYERLKEGK